jgi:DNA (cytosine-5)-methyltransferase 1
MIATRHKQLGRGTGFGLGEVGDAQFTISAGHEHAVCYAIDQQGGKGGANYAENVMPTLCSDSHGTPHAVAYSFDSLASNSMKSSNPHSGCRQTEVSKCLDTTNPDPSKNQGGVAVVEAVPYTLKIRTGVAVDSAGKAAGKGALIRENKAATLAVAQDQDLFQPIPIHDQTTRFSGKRGDKSDGKGNGLGIGNPGDAMNTLTAGDRHAVAYLASGKDSVGTLMANAGTKLWLGNQEAFSGDYHIVEETEPPAVRYIVRRLTPTECARLQGFPDKWGHPDHKSELTDEEYAFWLNVRNTHAEINGKAVKEYTRDQMLTWYNKLHTDSAEYKLWGNGIALPCALYVLEGIAEELKEG